jgi:hypothetical protein
MLVTQPTKNKYREPATWGVGLPLSASIKPKDVSTSGVWRSQQSKQTGGPTGTGETERVAPRATSEKSDGTMVLYSRKGDGFHDARMACR